MFNNLVESCKHSEDYKRKGSFFLATTIIYAVFLASAGIASVFAYDAHLENQSLELVSLLSPVPVQQQTPKPNEPKPAKNNDQKQAMRTVLIDRVADSYKAPDKISSTASTIPERPKGNVIIGNTNYDPPDAPVGPSNGDSSNNQTSNTKPVVIDEQPPPDVKKVESPVAPKPPTLVSKGVVNGIAKHLQTPAYPQIAKTAGIKGQVKVQVLIDETGKVVSANVVSGHPLLSAAAVQAARQSSFTPTKLSDVPVKVSGFILYNFTF
jgi:protein TonB